MCADATVELDPVIKPDHRVNFEVKHRLIHRGLAVEVEAGRDATNHRKGMLAEKGVYAIAKTERPELGRYGFLNLADLLLSLSVGSLESGLGLLERLIRAGVPLTSFRVLLCAGAPLFLLLKLTLHLPHMFAFGVDFPKQPIVVACRSARRIIRRAWLRDRRFIRARASCGNSTASPRSKPVPNDHQMLHAPHTHPPQACA